MEPTKTCIYQVTMPQKDTFFCRNRSVNRSMNLVCERICERCERRFEEHPLRPMNKIYPSYWRRVWNYLFALTEHLFNQQKKISGKKQRERKEICEACPYFDSIKVSCEHSKCGCGSRSKGMQEKWSWASSTCPLDRW